MQITQAVAIRLQRAPYFSCQGPVRHHIQEYGASIAYQVVGPASDDEGAEEARDRVHP